MKDLIYSHMLKIRTTDSQILISKNGEEFEGLAKNSLRYKPGKDQLTFYLGNSTTVFVWEYWSASITVNDVAVTKKNVNESMEALFTHVQTAGSSELPSGIYEASLYINKKVQ